MKNRGMKNPFGKEVRMFWQFEHPYSFSGVNGTIDLHHILGRVSNSIYNSIPIERLEHDDGKIHCQQTEEFFLIWTRRFVDRAMVENPDVYTLTAEDIRFKAETDHIINKNV